MRLFISVIILSLLIPSAYGQKPRFRAVVMTESGGIHQPFVDAARIWLKQLAADSSFTIDYIENTEKINDRFLSQYQLFIQLNYPPYMWNDTAKAAFIKYIEQGKGGWIGFHHATLLGEFDGYPIWPWFSDFMGGIRFRDYIPGFASGKVNVEASSHPVMKNMPASFIVEKDEWYVYDKSPRKNVHVLASVDESTYQPVTDKKMGDHPVVWSNEKMKARNIYIFMGHHPGLFNNSSFTLLFRNAIFWASAK
ncbi:MAG: ThuA domain-containing protein [Flavitalea sp.]